MKTQTRGSNNVWRSTSLSDKDKDPDSDVEGSAGTNENRLSLNLSSASEPLPRIAEEKDSPTNSNQGQDSINPGENTRVSDKERWNIKDALSAAAGKQSKGAHDSKVGKFTGKPPHK